MSCSPFGPEQGCETARADYELYTAYRAGGKRDIMAGWAICVSHYAPVVAALSVPLGAIT